MLFSWRAITSAAIASATIAIAIASSTIVAITSATASIAMASATIFTIASTIAIASATIVELHERAHHCTEEIEKEGGEFKAKGATLAKNEKIREAAKKDQDDFHATHRNTSLQLVVSRSKYCSMERLSSSFPLFSTVQLSQSLTMKKNPWTDSLHINLTTTQKKTSSQSKLQRRSSDF